MQVYWLWYKQLYIIANHQPCKVKGVRSYECERNITMLKKKYLTQHELEHWECRGAYPAQGGGTQSERREKRTKMSS
ncbi:hypothetical protein LguiA_023850 [Lonicera macranthoides]